jgi:O-antigen ligase
LQLDGLGVLLLVYLAWFALSWMWATEPSLSLRRVVGTSCEVVAAIAVARQLSPRPFAWLVLLTALAWSGLGLLAEAANGTFYPLDPEYRFTGLFHPNMTGAACAVGLIAAVYLARGTHAVTRAFLWSTAGVCLGLLLMTGSRTAAAALLGTCAIGWLSMRRTGPLVLAVALGLLALLWIAALAGSETSAWLADAITLGRVDSDIGSATGRVPLWNELLSYIADRPFMGYGYNSFWTADRMYELADSEWGTYGHSHSTYLELALSLGLIGVVLAVGSMVWAMLRARRLEAQSPRSGYGFVGLVILYSLIASLTETVLGQSWFLSFFLVSAAFSVIFRETNLDAYQSRAGDAALSRGVWWS